MFYTYCTWSYCTCCTICTLHIVIIYIFISQALQFIIYIYRTVFALVPRFSSEGVRRKFWNIKVSKLAWNVHKTRTPSNAKRMGNYADANVPRIRATRGFGNQRYAFDKNIRWTLCCRIRIKARIYRVSNEFSPPEKRKKKRGTSLSFSNIFLFD